MQKNLRLEINPCACASKEFGVVEDSKLCFD